jgi:hypothetical protein
VTLGSFRGDRRRSLHSAKIRTGAKQADRIRGARRRSLHSGKLDHRSADGLRRLPAAITSPECPGGAAQADRIWGDRRRSLHSGKPDRLSADGLRRLPAAITSPEFPGGAAQADRIRKTGSSVGRRTPAITGGDNLTGVSGRRFSLFPVPDSGPCSGANLCDVHFR